MEGLDRHPLNAVGVEGKGIKLPFVGWGSQADRQKRQTEPSGQAAVSGSPAHGWECSQHAPFLPLLRVLSCKARSDLDVWYRDGLAGRMQRRRGQRKEQRQASVSG